MFRDYKKISNYSFLRHWCSVCQSQSHTLTSLDGFWRGKQEWKKTSNCKTCLSAEKLFSFLSLLPETWVRWGEVNSRHQQQQEHIQRQEQDRDYFLQSKEFFSSLKSRDASFPKRSFLFPVLHVRASCVMCGAAAGEKLAPRSYSVFLFLLILKKSAFSILLLTLVKLQSIFIRKN